MIQSRFIPILFDVKILLLAVFVFGGLSGFAERDEQSFDYLLDQWAMQRRAKGELKGRITRAELEILYRQWQKQEEEKKEQQHRKALSKYLNNSEGGTQHNTNRWLSSSTRDANKAKVLGNVGLGVGDSIHDINGIIESLKRHGEATNDKYLIGVARLIELRENQKKTASEKVIEASKRMDEEIKAWAGSEKKNSDSERMLKALASFQVTLQRYLKSFNTPPEGLGIGGLLIGTGVAGGIDIGGEFCYKYPNGRMACVMGLGASHFSTTTTKNGGGVAHRPAPGNPFRFGLMVT